MAGAITWQSGGSTFPLQLSGAGREITNGVNYLCSGILYNDGRSGALAYFGTAELVLAASGFGAAANNNVNIDLYLLPSIDGTNFALGTTSGLPVNALKGNFMTPVSGNPTRLRMAVEGIPLLPLVYQAWLQNSTGQTMSSGWSLDIKLNNDYYN